VADAALDHSAVEELERIERPELEGALRVAQRLAAVPGPLERPSEDVVPVDRRPLALCKACKEPRAPLREEFEEIAAAFGGVEVLESQGIRYPDFEKARAFWVDTMGWRVLQTWPYGDLTLAYVLPPNQDEFHLEILAWPGRARPPRRCSATSTPACR